MECARGDSFPSDYQPNGILLFQIKWNVIVVTVFPSDYEANRIVLGSY